MILIEIPSLTKWRPLSRTKKLDPLLEKLSEGQQDKMLDAFAKHITTHLKAAAIHAIQTQHFPTRYPPLSKKYAALKRKLGLNPGFWIRTGFLVKHITTWKYHGIYYVGWHPTLVHQEDGTLVSDIAKSMEFGNPKMNVPARPLFTLLAKAMSKHIIDVHFRRFWNSYKSKIRVKNV